MTTLRSDPSAAAVLVFLIGSLGDTVVALPAFHDLRRRFDKARIVLLTNTPVDGGLKAASSVQILEGSGLVDEFIEYPHGRWSPAPLLGVMRRVRTAAPRVGAYLIQRRTWAQVRRDRFFFWACGVRTMVGSGFRRTEYRPTALGDQLWESEAARMLRSIGTDRTALTRDDFCLHLSPQERKAAFDVLAGAGVVQAFIVASVGTKVPIKDWGEDRWSEFLDCLARAAPSMNLVLIGSADESERSARLAQRWPWKTANLCGQLAPRVSAAVLERARLFVGHDSGPMHLAAAVGTTVISVFSAREMPGVWFPFGQEHNVFYRNVPCRDCRLDECVEFKKRCIRDIEPADVAQRALDRLLVEHSQGVGT